jgi:hypothetical protein
MMTGCYPNPRSSSTFCRELGGAPDGESSASGCFRALSRAHQGFPASLRRPFGLKGRLSPSPATGKTIRSTQGAFRPGEHPEEWRIWPGEPDKDLFSCGGEPFSTGCSQHVEKGPALHFIVRRAVL